MPWIRVDAGGMQPEMHLLLSVLGKCAESASMDERRGRYYGLPAHERDRQIVALRQRG
jgi:hypothetical protein